MTDTISRADAIDRMRDGLPCETRNWPDIWGPTRWADFDCNGAQFRIPPEPRREAREWWINESLSHAYTTQNGHGDRIHVREVLPDEVYLRKMTEAKLRQMFNDIALYSTGDIVAALVFARALGLLIEDNKP